MICLAKRKKDKIKISFVGNNATDVTGSMILIETETKNILLECGMVQSSNNIKDFQTNSKPFPFKAREIDYLFLNHCHIDHVGLTPKLIKDGFNGKIITSSITSKLLRPMLLDSAKIVSRDADFISYKRGREVAPYFNGIDVENTLSMISEFDYNKMYELDDNISFKLLHNAHIIGAYQLELFIKTSTGRIEKIFYTSDLGCFKTNNYYVNQNGKCVKSNIVISESTYGAKEKTSACNRDKDLEKIKTTIRQVCVEDKGRLLIPVFSLARCQQILTDLYIMYKDDMEFKIPIIVDSPLIWEITKVYKEVLDGENKQLFEDVCDWVNVQFIKDHNESKVAVTDKSPKIILSSSGFLNKGRSTNYLKEYIKNTKDGIIFVGYAPPTSIAGKIKKGQKYITIDGISYKNKCSIVILNSYSSHIPRQELINYLKSINAEKICLVHGEQDGKIALMQDLNVEIAKVCKSTKVIAVNKGTSFSL